MSHLALYRKYRSQTFEDLVGQEHITRTLQSAITSGRIAHAFLFVGPRGTGKTSTARIMAKALNCEKGPTPTPCGECRLCVAITSGSGGDVIELDAASESGIEEVRDIIESAKYSPMEGRYKIFVIDEVHDLSGKAFDAFLKTVEEPPAHVVFILATTAFNKVPLTIRSRCQCYEFHRGGVADIAGRLEHVCQSEGLSFEPAALNLIARLADGGYRDALTLLEQAVLVSPDGLTYDGVMRQVGLVDEEQIDAMLDAAASGETAKLIQLADEIIRLGKEPRSVLESLLLRLSEITHIVYGVDADSFEPSQRKSAEELAARIGKDNLLRYRSALADAHREIRDVSLPRIWLEVALTRLMEPVAAPAAPAAKPAPAPQPKPAAPPAEAKPHTPDQQAPPAQPEPRKPAQPIENPELGDLQERWKELVAYLQERYKAAGKMIDSTQVTAFEGKTAVVTFAKPFQYERITGNKKAQDTVVHGFQEVMGDPAWTIRFECNGQEPPADAAVQLPAEGQQLAGLVEQVFEVKPE